MIEWRSCIYVKKEIRTKELNDMEYLSEVKNFELSIIELIDYKIILICIYRSPTGNFEVFLNASEFVIQKLHNKKKRLIINGDWNINFLQDSSQVRETNNLLNRFNLIITVKDPTRTLKTYSSLLDVIITKEEILLEPARVIELVMSDHYAQILSILTKSHISRSYKTYKRQIKEENIHEFLYLLQQEPWQDIYRDVDVNKKFDKFLDNFLCYYDMAFPLRLTNKAKEIKKQWIPQGIKNSSMRIRLLEKQRKEMDPGQGELQYISNYKRIYRKVINKAKKKRQ
jgi:hypothetical protein